MKQLFLLIILVLPLNLLAKDDTITLIVNEQVKTVKSPQNRVVLLELYTSEGCSSCPPADRFLSRLKDAGISGKQLIPMAFHVTYWDYIGWQDPFADKQYDQRQRDQAHKHNSSFIYTPQFLLLGEDYRRYTGLSDDISKLVKQKASVDLELTVIHGDGKLHLLLKSDISRSEAKDVGYYFAVVENNLTSEVKAGENEGELLRHDYVVRKLSTPYFQSRPENKLETEHVFIIAPEWKKSDLSIIAFAENSHTGEVLQAVRLKY
ncbi:DUF1223 domain-containing protein [Cardiobacterium sp. AH-315-I02]|nr:DUF1223 domain-containing protein [Cardiobacterium sp. AH-315-I02]